MANNNNNANFQRALAMSMNARPDAPRPNNNNANLQRAMRASRGNNNSNLRNALRQSANNNRQRRQREREEMNREYEAAIKANLEAANVLANQRVNTPPFVPAQAPVNFNQMLPNMKPKVNNSSLAKAMRVATPENTAALAEEFPQFPYVQIEKILKSMKGNVNATRKNLIRRKTVLKLGGTRRNNRK